MKRARKRRIVTAADKKPQGEKTTPEGVAQAVPGDIGKETNVSAEVKAPEKPVEEPAAAPVMADIGEETNVPAEDKPAPRKTLEERLEERRLQKEAEERAAEAAGAPDKGLAPEVLPPPVLPPPEGSAVADSSPTWQVDNIRDRISRSRKISAEELRELEARGREKYEKAKDLYDAHDGKVRNFDDIFAHFPMGNGEFEIYIERKSPQRYQGRKISGIQRSVTTVMDHREFAETYGTGVYMMTVYGPARNGALDEEGNLKLMPYTKPIRVEIPDPYNENPPNLEMAAVGNPAFEMDGEMMRGNRRVVGGHFGGATDADAHIREVELRHEESAEERRLRIQAEEREREERKREAEQRRQDDFATRMLESKERELEMLREEMRELRNRPDSEESKLSGVAQLLAAVRPPSSQGQVEHLTQTLADERRRYSEEMNRLRDTHRSEVDRIIREKDEIIRVERERADIRIREANEASRQRESDLRINLEQRLADERRQHDRDLQSVRESHNMVHVSGENTFKMQLEVKQAEVGRLQQENLRLQAELDAERKKSLAERVNEFSSAAEALGFNKDDGGDTSWKSMLSDAALGLIQHAPSLASALRGGGAPMQSMPIGSLPPARQPMPMPMPQQAFATDGVDMDFGGSMDPSGTYQPPVYGSDGYEDGGDDEQMQQPVSGYPPPQAAPTQSMVHQQVQSQPPQPSASPQASSGGGFEVEDSQILEFSSMFREAFSQGAESEGFSDEIVSQLGPLMSGSIVREVPLQRVIQVLQQGPDGDTDPLVRRDGQKFLSEVWQKVAAKTEQK